MIRFKKQFLFLFSFLFKIPAILSQQEVSNINVSQQSFSYFSFFLSFFFFFHLRKCLSCWSEACNKVHLLIYYWWNRIFSVSLFLFWIHVTFQYLGICRRKTVWVVLIFDKFQCSYSFLSSYGRVTSRGRLTSAIGLYRWFFPNSVLFFLWETFPGVGWDRRLSFDNFCPKLKILFQISLTEK